MKVVPSGRVLGAAIEGVDLARLAEGDFQEIYRALAEHGVLRFPRQELTARQLRDFAARWGELK
jgi:taurine dioxygenase